MAQYRNLENCILLTLDAYGLLEVELVRDVKIAWSADGADLTNLHKHTSLGCRVVDLEAKVPGNDELLFHIEFDNTGEVVLKNYHCKEIANFMMICGTSETGGLYRVHERHFFDFIKKIYEEGIWYNGRTYHVSSTFPADMSCHWKVLNLGGACKVKKLFCHYCPCASNDDTSFCTSSLCCDWCKK